MCPRGEVIAEVSLQNPFQMPLAEHDHMIEAFPTNTTNEPFSEWILPRTLSRREYLCLVKMPLGLAMLNLSTSDGKLAGQ
jgi:hypothetical protein